MAFGFGFGSRQRGIGLVVSPVVSLHLWQRFGGRVFVGGSGSQVRPAVGGAAGSGGGGPARWAARLAGVRALRRAVHCRGLVVVAPLVGFSGSRSLPPSASPQVAAVVAAVVAGGRGVAVGCARGADQAVRLAAPGAQVFFASSFAGPAAARLAQRSAAMVAAVAASGPGCGLVGFPAQPCPVGLGPSASASACFSGSGSGTWATLALAAGLGLPVVVFPVGFAPSSLPAGWGQWVPAGGGAWVGGWRLVPVASQPSLF